MKLNLFAVLACNLLLAYELDFSVGANSAGVFAADCLFNYTLKDTSSSKKAFYAVAENKNKIFVAIKEHLIIDSVASVNANSLFNSLNTIKVCTRVNIADVEVRTTYGIGFNYELAAHSLIYHILSSSGVNYKNLDVEFGAVIKYQGYSFISKKAFPPNEMPILYGQIHYQLSNNYGAKVTCSAPWFRKIYYEDTQIGLELSSQFNKYTINLNIEVDVAAKNIKAGLSASFGFEADKKRQYVNFSHSKYLMGRKAVEIYSSVYDYHVPDADDFIHDEALRGYFAINEPEELPIETDVAAVILSDSDPLKIDPDPCD